MRVRVKLFATLADLAPAHVRQRHANYRAGHPFTWDLPAGSSLCDLIDALALPQAEIKQVFVNGRARPLDHLLTEDDQVGIFPPVGGG